MTKDEAIRELQWMLKVFLACQASDGTKCAPNDVDFEKAREVLTATKEPE